MSFGITPQGFKRPTFLEIRDQKEADYVDFLGPINKGAESAVWQTINIEAEREDLIWQALEAVYLNSYPRSASGSSLDGAVELIGITRLPGETDPELLKRSQESIQIFGAGTPSSIRARLRQQVSGVLAVTIVENVTEETDADGRPPKSFEVVITGGDDQEIADLIWLVKPAGIRTVGEIGMTVLDSENRPQLIRFSRPIEKFAWIEIELSISSGDTFPENGIDLVKENLIAYGQSLNVGDDLIFQAFFGPIYGVPGIQNVTLLTGVNDDPEVQPQLDNVNIQIAPNEITLWAADRINVTII